MCNNTQKKKAAGAGKDFTLFFGVMLHFNFKCAASRCLLQDEPRGKNIAQSFLFTAKSITKKIVFFATFSLYLWSENVETF